MPSVSLQSRLLGSEDRTLSNGCSQGDVSMELLFRIVERWYPLAGGFVVSCVYLSVPQLRQYVFPATLPVLLSAVVTIGGVAVGFLATIKSILLTIDDKPIMGRIKDGGLYIQIVDYLRAAFFWSFALTILSAFALFIDYQKLSEWSAAHAAGTAAWLWVATSAGLSYYRVSSIWYTVLKHLDVKHP